MFGRVVNIPLLSTIFRKTILGAPLHHFLRQLKKFWKRKEWKIHVCNFTVQPLFYQPPIVLTHPLFWEELRCLLFLLPKLQVFLSMYDLNYFPSKSLGCKVLIIMVHKRSRAKVKVMNKTLKNVAKSISYIAPRQCYFKPV